MRDKSTRKHIDTALENVESALRDLSDRLEEALPGRKQLRHRVARAENTLRRTAHSVADRLPRRQTASLVESAERTVRAHPVRVALTAAVAGYCAWSIIRYANGRTTTRRERLDEAGPFRTAAEAVREHAGLRH